MEHGQKRVEKHWPKHLNDIAQATITQTIPMHFSAGMNDKIYNATYYIYIYMHW